MLQSCADALSTLLTTAGFRVTYIDSDGENPHVTISIAKRRLQIDFAYVRTCGTVYSIVGLPPAYDCVRYFTSDNELVSYLQRFAASHSTTLAHA